MPSIDDHSTWGCRTCGNLVTTSSDLCVACGHRRDGSFDPSAALSITLTKADVETTTRKKPEPFQFRLSTLLVLVTLFACCSLCLVPWNSPPSDSSYVVHAIEVMKMAEGFEIYKVDHGSLPPNFSDQAAVVRHLRHAFPRYQGPYPTGLDAAEALVFWLCGYGSNPTFPLDPATSKTPYFDFDASRFTDIDRDGFVEYTPRSRNAIPYVYYHMPTYTPESRYSMEGHGIATAYLCNKSGKYMCPESFQIISAGADAHYGVGGSFPSGKGYHRGDHDNVTNFSEGTLQSKQ